MEMDSLEVGWVAEPYTLGVPLFLYGVVRAWSFRGHAFGDLFLISIVCSLGFTLDRIIDSLQGMVCGNVDTKYQRKSKTNR